MIKYINTPYGKIRKLNNSFNANDLLDICNTIELKRGGNGSFFIEQILRRVSLWKFISDLHGDLTYSNMELHRSQSTKLIKYSSMLKKYSKYIYRHNNDFYVTLPLLVEIAGSHTDKTIQVWLIKNYCTLSNN